MGLGVAKLLKAHDYRVLTVGLGRSEDTLARIRSAAIESLPSDQELVVQSDYILSIVPPRDALATARRISEACQLPDTAAQRVRIPDLDGLKTRRKPYYFDLNAISPRLTREVGSLLAKGQGDDDEGTLCHFIDGGIIGGPPSQDPGTKAWKKPSIVISGSVDLPPSFHSLSEILNMKLVSPTIGSASTLKLSFAALTKGLTALSILSFSTAQKESVLPELLEHLQQYSPATASLTAKGITGMPPKAYRWVEEMRAIGEAFDTEGDWHGLGESVYGAFAEVYRTVAEDTILGEEKIGKRNRGTTAEDVSDILARRSQRDVAEESAKRRTGLSMGSAMLACVMGNAFTQGIQLASEIGELDAKETPLDRIRIASHPAPLVDRLESQEGRPWQQLVFRPGAGVAKIS
ncbi:conserved hypothetical protein [Paecilomyces variotii No. 5]|uniref:Phosphogluconate dehydrogenase NAD-binding putative C-terminal domain-containing protein n=1 Tax=Byssochlamys spectabilis (strain No. 5 / NBRC 109023) TaxID=1356009 RepID=V5FCY7_BYSSN|nr:conserved hypothetical protein [Paecilomyces variotii No. 5]